MLASDLIKLTEETERIFKAELGVKPTVTFQFLTDTLHMEVAVRFELEEKGEYLFFTAISYEFIFSPQNLNLWPSFMGRKLFDKAKFHIDEVAAVGW